MEVIVYNGEEDLIALNEHAYYTRPAFRRQHLTWWLLMPALLVLIGLLLAHQTGDISVAYMLCAAAIIYAVLHPIILKWARHRNVRRLLSSGSNLGIFSQAKMIISPTEIARYSKYGYAAYYWPAVERIEVSASHLFVFVSAMNAFIIPKRSFSSESAFNLFVETARRYWQDSQLQEAPLTLDTGLRGNVKE